MEVRNYDILEYKGETFKMPSVSHRTLEFGDDPNVGPIFFYFMKILKDKDFHKILAKTYKDSFCKEYNFYNYNGKKLNFLPLNEVNQKGFFSTYLIKDNKFYLKSFYGLIDDKRRSKIKIDGILTNYNIDINYLFKPDDIEKSCVFADWYSGRISVGNKNSVSDEFCTTGKSDSTSLSFIIDKGVVTDVFKDDSASFRENISNNYIGDIYKGELIPSIEWFIVLNRLDNYTHILEDKTINELMILADNFDKYKNDLDYKSFHYKRDIFDDALIRFSKDKSLKTEENPVDTSPKRIYYELDNKGRNADEKALIVFVILLILIGILRGCENSNYDKYDDSPTHWRG
jgi:hypothetical protein